MRFDFFAKEILMKSTFVSAKQMFLVAMVAARVVLRSFFFFVACAPETVTQRKFFFVSLQIKGCWPFQRTYKSAKLIFLFSLPWSVFNFFFCLETLLKVSEIQGRNDLYQHKMHDDWKVGRRGLAKFRLLTKTSCWLQLRNNKFIIRNLASRGKTPTLAASFSIITYQGCASRYNLAPRVVLVICRRYGCRCKEPKWPWARDWSRQGNLRNWGGSEICEELLNFRDWNML